ncbi:hypothetical protein [Niveispirillum sp.]|uniref:hypothetical protein n=1 Tax=Niveispirillum sp. TaxID=1917217 RepID=UPI001B3FE3FE|nr:hypothetical protein [Niveispirillum sp.]MBP7339805.1 hypothetical protein [Niveispirillum sp.]
MANRVKQLADMHIGRHLTYTDSDRRADEARGARDGEKNFPPLDAPQNPVQDQVLAQATADFAAYEKARLSHLAELEQGEQQKLKERDEELVNRRTGLQDERQRTLHDLSHKVGPDSPQFRDLVERRTEAVAALGKLEAELARPLRVSLVWAYPFLMLLVCLAEVPVNRMAFEFFFQETPLLSLFISLVIGGVLALFAHFIGLWLKQANRHERMGARLSYYAGALVLAGLSGALVYFIAAMRQHFLALLEADAGTSFADLLRQGDLTATAAQVTSTELGSAGWTLLVINLVILTVGVVASFVRHDPHPDYEPLSRKADKARARVTKREADYNKQRVQAARKYDDMIAALNRQIERLEKEIAEIQAGRKAAAADYEQSLRQLGMTSHNRLINYRNGNLRARTDGTPACLREVPSALQISAQVQRAVRG